MREGGQVVGRKLRASLKAGRGKGTVRGGQGGGVVGRAVSKRKDGLRMAVPSSCLLVACQLADAWRLADGRMGA